MLTLLPEMVIDLGSNDLFLFHHSIHYLWMAHKQISISANIKTLFSLRQDQTLYYAFTEVPINNVPILELKHEILIFGFSRVQPKNQVYYLKRNKRIIVRENQQFATNTHFKVLRALFGVYYYKDTLHIVYSSHRFFKRTLSYKDWKKVIVTGQSR